MQMFFMNLFLNIHQLDALNFIIGLFQASTCFEHMCSSSGGQKLYYTVSGIITPTGGRPVHRFCAWTMGWHKNSRPYILHKIPTYPSTFQDCSKAKSPCHNESELFRL